MQTSVDIQLLLQSCQLLLCCITTCSCTFLPFVDLPLQISTVIPLYKIQHRFWFFWRKCHTRSFNSTCLFNISGTILQVLTTVYILFNGVFFCRFLFSINVGTIFLNDCDPFFCKFYDCFQVDLDHLFSLIFLDVLATICIFSDVISNSCPFHSFFDVAT